MPAPASTAAASSANSSRPVPGVAADAPRRPRRRPGRRSSSHPASAAVVAADHRAVHPVRPGADRAAQARGAELQPPGEPVGQLGQRRLPGRLGCPATPAAPPARPGPARPGRRRSSARPRVAQITAAITGDTAGSTPASSAPIRSAAARPAATTSAWSSPCRGQPRGQVGDQRDAPAPRRPGGGRRSPPARWTCRPGRRRASRSIADLGRRLVVRPGQRRVHALGQARVGLPGQRAQPRPSTGRSGR